MSWISKVLGSHKESEVSREQRTIENLLKFTIVTPGTTTPHDPKQMLSAIDEVEQNFGSNIPPSVADALASTVLCYTAWHVRGDARRGFLERAVRYYRMSGNKAGLGRLLVNEAQVRNLKEAIPLLEELYTNSTNYDPALCSYAEALYKDGQYVRAYEVATHIHGLAEKTKKYWDAQMEQLKRCSVDLSQPEYVTTLHNWMSSLPTAPMELAAKALRAEAKRLKKAGQQKEAIAMLKQLQETGRATNNDVRELERLTVSQQ
jgi:tetratricopeptide (TPR) repeat protein